MKVPALGACHRGIGELALHHSGAIRQRAQAVSSKRALEPHSTQIIQTVGRASMIELAGLVATVGYGRTRSRRNFAFDQVCPAILLVPLIRCFVVLQRATLIHILRFDAGELVLGPLDKVIRVEE